MLASACSSLPHRYISTDEPLVVDTLKQESSLPTSEIYSNYHGLRGHDDFIYFGGGKYNFYIGSYDLEPTSKNKSQITKRIASGAVSDSLFNISGLSIERFIKKTPHDTLTLHHSVYIIGLTDRTDVIGFTSYFPENYETELSYVRSYINEGLYSDVLTPIEIESFKFAGRDIELPNLCKWSGPSNLRCGENGQLSWTVHAEYNDAEFSKNVSIYDNTVLRKIEPMLSDTISVNFEESKTEAIKHVYRISSARRAMGVPPSIIVYYVAAPVRGQYVAATMSHYNDEAPKGELPLLLSEVMELSDDEISELPDIPDRSLVYPSRLIEFKTGIWVPVGNLSKTMHPSPFGAFQINLFPPFLSVNMRFIYNSKTSSFDFSSESEGPINVTSNVMAAGDLRINIPKYLSESNLLNSYIGVGVSSLLTNEKDPSKAGTNTPSTPGDLPESEHYSVETVGVVFGSSLIWQIHNKSRLGVFAEYNFAPYGLNKRVSSSLGSHAFSFGINFNF